MKKLYTLSYRSGKSRKATINLGEWKHLLRKTFDLNRRYNSLDMMKYLITQMHDDCVRMKEYDERMALKRQKKKKKKCSGARGILVMISNQIRVLCGL